MRCVSFSALWGSERNHGFADVRDTSPAEPGCAALRCAAREEEEEEEADFGSSRDRTLSDLLVPWLCETSGFVLARRSLPFIHFFFATHGDARGIGTTLLPLPRFWIYLEREFRQFSPAKVRKKMKIAADSDPGFL